VHGGSHAVTEQCPASGDGAERLIDHSRKETTMSLHSPTVIVPARPRTGRVAALVAATCVTAGGIAIAVAGDQAAPRVVPAAEQATTRYFDIEANKVASMRALARHIAEQRANRASRYDDLEANKARSRRSR